MPHSLNDVIVSVVALGMLAQWLAWRFQFPAIILLALTGLLIGPILGWIHPAADLGDEGCAPSSTSASRSSCLKAG